jgi:hypothetical protein
MHDKGFIPSERNHFYRGKTLKEDLYIIYKVFRALWREGLYWDFFVFLRRQLRLMSIPNSIVNIARQLTEEQMLAMQLEFSYLRGKGAERLTDEEKVRFNQHYKAIEEILIDYAGLDLETLTVDQIRGFVWFVVNCC